MSDKLPHDLQIDILVRLPVKSLLRFQCVSKSLKSLIRSSAFISTHTNHNESTNNYTHLVKGRLCWTDNDEEIDFKPKFHQFDDSFSEFQKIEFSSPTNYEYSEQVLDCRGLLLLTERVGTFILWNPAVRMTLTLPRPFTRVRQTTYYYSVHGFGFDPKSNDYKVVIMVYGQFPTRAEVFKLSTGAWESVRFMDDFHCVIPPWNFQTFVNGATHWIGCHSTEHLSKEKSVVVLFHMSDEKFRMMKLPDVLNTVNQYLIFPVVFGGLLSLIHYNTEDGHYMSVAHVSCCIWLIKDYGVIESWTKQCTIDLRDFGGLKRTFSFRNNRVQFLIETRSEELVLYDLKTNRFIHLGIRNMDEQHSMNTNIESLVLFNQIYVVPEYKTSPRKTKQLTKWLEKA